MLNINVYLYPNCQRTEMNILPSQPKTRYLKTPCIVFGGGERDRTDDLLRARQALSQLSYTPKKLVLNTVSSDGGPGWS